MLESEVKSMSRATGTGSGAGDCAGSGTVRCSYSCAWVELWGCFVREATDEQTARFCLQPALD